MFTENKVQQIREETCEQEVTSACGHASVSPPRCLVFLMMLIPLAVTDSMQSAVETMHQGLWDERASTSPQELHTVCLKLLDPAARWSSAGSDALGSTRLHPAPGVTAATTSSGGTRPSDPATLSRSHFGVTPHVSHSAPS